MTVRIDEHGCLIVGDCALPAAVVPAVEAFYREQFKHGGVVAEEPEWEYGIHLDAFPNGPVIPVASEARAMAEAAIGEMSGGVTAMRRAVRTGEWVPVKQEGAAQ